MNESSVVNPPSRHAPPVVGADFLAALVANCLRGAFPPVDLRAVCFVRAMSSWPNDARASDGIELERSGSVDVESLDVES